MSPFHFQSNPVAQADERAIAVPVKLAGKAELLAFLARAIPLPDYFGHNWDALEECLREIGEPDRPKLALVHEDVPLEPALSDQRIYLKVLAGVAQGSTRLSIFFPEKCRAQVLSILD